CTMTGLMSIITTLGCSTLTVPSLSIPTLPVAVGGLTGLDSLGRRDSNYEFVGQGAGPAPKLLSEAVYQKVRQAKAENAIVLQLTGDDVPLRVLPLPPAGRGVIGVDPSATDNFVTGLDGAAPSVFVSTLINQTGIGKKIGPMEATLFRHSTGHVNGIRMDVLFDGKDVRPETDYALRAGDRLVIQSADGFGIEQLVDMALGRS
ncbi:MAG: hypothetical protein AAF745_07200, partial [Planctomycetota bacterium]